MIHLVLPGPSGSLLEINSSPGLYHVLCTNPDGKIAHDVIIPDPDNKLAQAITYLAIQHIGVHTGERPEMEVTVVITRDA
jgi:hypothetical protein